MMGEGRWHFKIGARGAREAGGAQASPSRQCAPGFVYSTWLASITSASSGSHGTGAADLEHRALARRPSEAV